MKILFGILVVLYVLGYFVVSALIVYFGIALTKVILDKVDEWMTKHSK